MQSIEVLRDGASAQYGSDAIAGVINLRLREATRRRQRVRPTAARDYELRHADHGTRARGRDLVRTGDAVARSGTDGETLTVSAWKGLALGESGS